ncbi:MAG: amino acid ABC transporter permease, partial [Lactobacillus iners]|nr:amino acid ABC transporter permease [Lactobacillus iners]
MINILVNHWPQFMQGLSSTIMCSLIAIFFSLIIGVICALVE